MSMMIERVGMRALVTTVAAGAAMALAPAAHALVDPSIGTTCTINEHAPTVAATNGNGVFAGEVLQLPIHDITNQCGNTSPSI